MMIWTHEISLKWYFKTWWGAGDSETVLSSPGYISSPGTIVSSLLAWGKTLSSFLAWGETSAVFEARWGVSLMLEDELGDLTLSGKISNVFMVWEREIIEFGLGISNELGGLGKSSRLGEMLMDSPWIEKLSGKCAGISWELFEGASTISEISEKLENY